MTKLLNATVPIPLGVVLIIFAVVMAYQAGHYRGVLYAIDYLEAQPQ